MDDRKLETLLTAVRTGSFSKAADELICTQSAVTQIMNSLESELGVKLVERSHSGVRLSDAGEELLPYIVEAESALARLREEAKIVAEGAVRPLRIASFSSIANTWLPDILTGFEKEEPDVRYDIRVGSIGFEDMMMNGEIDMVLGTSSLLKGFRWYPLMEDPYYALMPKDMAPEGATVISQEDFAEYRWIIAPLNEMAKNLDVEPKNKDSMTVVTDDDSTLINMVAKGMGVTAVPKLFINELPEEVVMLGLDPVPTRTLGIFMAHRPPEVAERFRDHLLRHAAAISQKTAANVKK